MDTSVLRLLFWLQYMTKESLPATVLIVQYITSYFEDLPKLFFLITLSPRLAMWQMARAMKHAVNIGDSEIPRISTKSWAVWEEHDTTHVAMMIEVCIYGFWGEKQFYCIF